MRIRKVRKIRYITFINASLSENNEYVGESFEAVVVNDTITKFIDWLNGNGEVIPIGDYTQGDGWDFDFFHNAYALSEVEIVTQLLQQHLSIQLGELIYSFEDTSNIGIPYINKKKQEEMDLILRDEIASTQGVAKILTFKSVMEDRLYKLEFTVETNGGDTVWLTTEV